MVKWIAVFRTGRHTDSKGRTRTWTAEELDHMVKSYKPEDNEAPVVLGHPKDNAPAWGWVEGLRREGEVLYAGLKDLVPEFVDMLRKKMFKKRSISINPDGTLRHIGFLGATPPAVKGLPDIAFGSADEQVIEFEEFAAADKQAQEARAKKYGISVKDGGHVAKPGEYAQLSDEEFADPVNYRYPIDKEHCQAALSYWGREKNRSQYTAEEVRIITKRILAAAKKHGIDVDESKWKFAERRQHMTFMEKLRAFLKQEGGEDVDVPKLFTEGEVKEHVAAAVREKKTEFSRAAEEKETELKKREESIKKQEAEGRKAGIAAFCEGLQKEGRLTPAMMKHGMGVQAFMEAIAGIETTHDFAEGEGKQTPREFFESFLKGLPAQIKFGEVTGGPEPEGGRGDEQKREKLVAEHMKNNEGVSYKEAVLAVSQEHPDLFKDR